MYPQPAMKASVDRDELLMDLVQLRRAERNSPDPEPIAEVRSHLESAIGRVVSRAAAARLLGISQTALDRWIKRGELSVVLTAAGRRQVPVRELMGLSDAIETRRRADPDDPHPLSSVFRARRERVGQMTAESILPRRYRRGGATSGHRPAELRGLAYHRAVAQRLDGEVTLDARTRLREWRASGHIDEQSADAWERVLCRPLDQIARIITQDSVAGRALRQTSPLTGVLSEPERRRVLELATRE